jgi:hypothetical protein
MPPANETEEHTRSDRPYDALRLDLEGGPEINSSGEVIGLGDADAWIWDQADGVRFVNNLAPMGWTIDGVFGINNSGQILATASFEGSRIDYVLLTPESTPEPATVILTSAAFLVVGIILGLRRRFSGRLMPYLHHRFRC